MKLLALSLALLLPPLVASAAPPLAQKDVQVVAHQHAVNQMEIGMGTMALKQGSVAIKAYATNLVNDHKAADAKVIAFAKAHALAPIPEDPDASKDEMTKLAPLKGIDFDKEFVGAMIDGHTKEIARVDRDLAGVENADLAAMLRAVKPVMQKHADEARELAKSTPTRK
ncbi:MAG TPA: DUF4142 domain-containing protein [Kofleriaceae bacterium]|jgi:putative membrane protein